MLGHACFCQLFIKDCGLKDYITRVKGPKPATNDPIARGRDLENSLVMFWLINAMQPNIVRGCLLLDTTWKIWTCCSDLVLDR